MKYVRANFGAIFQIYNGRLTDEQREGEIRVFYPKDVIKKMSCPYAWLNKADILKQADTIEELIDCYAVILEHQDKPLVVYKNEIEHYKHCLVDKVKSNNRVLAIYGSIWVGADLLSKSKMNEKGELELL